MSNTSRTRVIAYARVSTAAQADGGVSLDAQRAKLTAYCIAMELDLIGIEADEGASAKTLDRPALQRALVALREGKADALLVVKLDRLTRSVRDLGSLVEGYFASGRWSLLSVADSIDTRSAAGRLVLNVLASVAQWEREAIGERTSDALAHLQAEGVQLGGEAFGWRRGDETDSNGRHIVEVVESEALAVDRMLALRAEGRSYREIARDLALEGIATKRGGNWHANTVRRVCERAA